MELLIRVLDKDGANPAKVHRMCQKGDVVVICPDGWRWSEKERTNPAWRIVRVPDLSKEEAEALIMREPGIGGNRRAFRVDLARLPQAFLSDNARREPIVTLPAASIVRLLRPAKAGPKNVIG